MINRPRAKASVNWLTGIASISLILVYALVYVPGTSLLRRSDPVGPAQCWLTDYGAYNWLSDNEYLEVLGNQRASSVSVYDRAVHGGRERCLTTVQLSRAGINLSEPGHLIEGADSGELSTDRNVMIIVANRSTKLVPLNKGNVLTVPLAAERGVESGILEDAQYADRSRSAWLEGGTRWVEIYYDKQGNVHLIERDMATVLNDRIVMSASTFGVTDVTTIWTFDAPPVVIGTTSDHVLLWDRANTVFDVTIGTKGDDVKSYTIPFPNGNGVDDLVLSPNHKLLLWRYGSAGFIHPVFHVGVCDVNGTHMREIAEQAFYNADPRFGDSSIFYAISQFRWLPDSRHFSFVYDHKLWVSPID